MAVRLVAGAGVTLCGELMANNKPYDANKFSTFASYIM